MLMLKKAGIIRDLLEKIGMFCSVEAALLDSMEEINRRLDELEDKNSALAQRNKVLDRNHAEVMSAFKTFRKDGLADVERRLTALEKR